MTDDILGRIRELTEERKIAQRDAEWKDQQWRLFIASAVKGGARVTDVAEAAGVSRERIYQIRDGRR